MLTLNSSNVFQNHISLSIPLSFRQRDDWDVLRLPSVSTLENPAALKTPRLRRSLVTPRGSACSIAGRTSHFKTPFYQLSFRRTGGRGKRVETDTATSLRHNYCLFQLVSADFNLLRTVTHKGQKQKANCSKCKRNPDTWMFRFSNGEKWGCFSGWQTSCRLFSFFKLTYRRALPNTSLDSCAYDRVLRAISCRAETYLPEHTEMVIYEITTNILVYIQDIHLMSI